MFTYLCQHWRCFFTLKAALLCLFFLNAILVITAYQGKARISHTQTQLRQAKEDLTKIQKNLHLFKSYKNLLEQQNTGLLKLTEAIHDLENNLSLYINPDFLSKDSATFLQRLRHHPEKYKNFGENIPKGLCFLLKCLKNDNREYARIENIGVLRNHSEEKLILPIKYVFDTENVESWFCKIQLQTTPNNFSNFLFTINDSRLPLWVQDISVEAKSLEAGILPTFTVLLQWCSPQLL